MNQKEFDAIYPKKLKPLQHEVLDMWLQGKSEEAIAKSLIGCQIPSFQYLQVIWF
jgi:DNA-binding NarL/FixJ family response regulator